MAVEPTTVAVGKCYRTANNQQRRVVEIKDGKVTYESWGGNVQNTEGPLKRITAKLDTFAGAVEEEIQCPADLPDMPEL